MNTNKIKTITRMLPAILSGAILIPWLSSCITDDLSDGGTSYEEKEITVPISLSVVPIQSGDSETRAEKEYIEATDDEKKIHDFWIIEYNEDGTRVGLPRYFVEEKGKELPKDIRIIIPRRDEDTFTCVLIANTNAPNMFSPDNRSEFSTLDDLRRFNTAAHNQETIFNPEEGKYLLMSGWTTITTNPDTHKLSFELIRNVCKVNVKLTDFPDDILFYKYFQWRDVPLGKMFPHGTVDYHQPVSRDWRQHDEDYLRVILQSPEGLDFYLPSNVWLPEGPNMPDAPTDSQSDDLIEEDPTHFCVVCRKIEGWRQDEPILSDDQYEYSVYPSKAVDKQFEFRLNHFYQIEMSIKGIPSEDNPFFKVIGYKQLEESNCYMIKRDSKEVFAVPLTRINKFWTSEDANDKFELTDETEWVAEVIWQDTPLRIIDFASYRGFEAAKDLSYLEGAGETSFAFRPTGTDEGNVIVGVRKKVLGWETIPVEQREYLWSWHLWITDYAPDELDDNGSYDWYYKEVPGGAVHRYPVIEYWKTDGANQYIMDRDLGAKFTFDRTNVLDEIYYHILSTTDWGYRFFDIFPSFGLYYQYGRKDPFPYSEGAYPDNPKDDERGYYPKDGIQKIYDIDGNLIPAFNKHTTMLISAPNEGNFEKAVKYPYVFYTASAASHFWHDPTVGNDEEVSPWLSPDWNDLETGKSIYDPCPPGWRVIPNIAVYGYWQDANLQNRIHHYMEISIFRLGSFIDLGDGHNAFYPASGRRDCVYGKIDYESDKEDESEYKHYFQYWTFSGLSEWWLESGDFDENNFNEGDGTNVFSLANWNYTTGEPAGTGLPVRCIRDVSPQ